MATKGQVYDNKRSYELFHGSMYRPCRLLIVLASLFARHSIEFMRLTSQIRNMMQ